MLDKLIAEAKKHATELAALPYDNRADQARLARRRGKSVTLKDFPREWLQDPSSEPVKPKQLSFAGDSMPISAHSV